jgi:glyceraldehyde-3-phosphate dehydrogenase (NADP+)
MSDVRRVLTPENTPDLILEAAAVLRAGGIVLVPTETVYGLVGADRPEVLDAMRAIKGDRGDKPFARLVSGLGEVEATGVIVTRPARALAERYWPGPLTLVLDDADGVTHGFRAPGLPFALELVKAAGTPLVGTSANESNEPPPVDFESAWDSVGAKVDLAVDGGRAALGSASTVVRLSPKGPPQVLRSGFLDEEGIDRVGVRKFVFVCTGNTCRSPMAEAMARHMLAERLGMDDDSPDALAGQGYAVESAGVAAYPGSPAADNAQAVMREFGLDITGHSSQPLSEALVESAARVVGLTMGHADGIARSFPDHGDKILVLDARGVPDPIGGSLDVYRQCAAHIAARLEIFLDQELEPDMSSLANLFPAAGEVPTDNDQALYADGDTYLIGGEVRRWDGPSLPVESCICDRAEDGTLTRRKLGDFAQLSAEVATDALKAATGAWDRGRGAWPQSSVAERVKAIEAFREGMRETRDEVVRLLMWEIGKPYASACKEFDRTVEYVDKTIEALRALDREQSVFQSHSGVMAQVRRAPLGVCLCMGPFNYPLNECYTTLIPALAMGNTAVVKLPRLGMLCNLPLLKALAAAFPPGVVNVIGGDGKTVVSPIISSGDVDVLAFIGSSKVAGIIEKQHPKPWRLTTILGMDAKNPAIVLDDADVDLAVKMCLEGSLSYNGQRCTALKILFVQRGVADEFVEKLVDGVSALTCGMPWTDGVAITPLPEDNKPEWLAELVADAVAKGAKVMNAGGGESSGTFFSPAVVYPVSKDAQLYSVEQFGPIVPVVPFDDVREVLDYVAESDFGQQVSLFGRDAKTLGPLIDELSTQVCRININRQSQRGPDVYPFTGRKNSAEGTLSVREALVAFSIDSLIAASDPEGRELVESIVAENTSTFMHKAD